MTPKPPQIIMGEFFVGRSTDRDDPGNPGVYARRQPPDSAPLARRIPAFKKNRAGNALLVGFIARLIGKKLAFLKDMIFMMRRLSR